MRQALVASLVVFASSCGPNLVIVGNGDVTTVERSLTGVQTVRLGLPASLTVKIGSPASVSLTGEGNLLSYVKSDVFLGTLELGVVPGASLTATKPMVFVLTVPSLRGLATESPGNITAPALSAKDFTLEVGSIGSIHVEQLEATTLDATISSAGAIVIDSGNVDTQRVHLTSSGVYQAMGMQSAHAVVEVESSGDAELFVTDTLDVTLTSSGNVRYLGAPKVTQHRSSSGTVAPVEP